MNARPLPELRAVPGYDPRWAADESLRMWSSCSGQWRQLRSDGPGVTVRTLDGRQVRRSPRALARLAWPETNQALVVDAENLRDVAERLAGLIAERLDVPASAAVAPAAASSPPLDSYWSRLASVVVADLGAHGASEVLGNGAATIRGWASGKNAPNDGSQSGLERLGVALLALRLGVDGEALDEARQLVESARCGRLDATAWTEVMG